MSIARTQELKEFYSSGHSLAKEIANLWDSWNTERSSCLEEQAELRNFLFATDTSYTTSPSTPWKNKTTIPKLTQIRDNLFANYMTALFPNEEWLKWEAYTLDSNEQSKAQAIEAYMSNKFREGNCYTVVSQLVLDYIDYGNAFFDIEYVREYKVETDGSRIPTFVGPKLVRISPMDIVFNPYAVDFRRTPKIVRSVMTL